MLSKYLNTTNFGKIKINGASKNLIFSNDVSVILEASDEISQTFEQSDKAKRTNSRLKSFL